MGARGTRPASVADVRELAMAMPHVTQWAGQPGKPPIYQVGGKSFVFFRNPRPDAVDPVTGERYDDVIVFWVADEADKRSLVEDPDSPFFTTPHFNGHLSVLLRGKHVLRLSYAELAEVVQDAWLARASPRRAATWLQARELDTRSHATVRDETGVDLSGIFITTFREQERRRGQAATPPLELVVTGWTRCRTASQAPARRQCCYSRRRPPGCRWSWSSRGC
jgi:hypothetical protein